MILTGLRHALTSCALAFALIPGVAEAQNQGTLAGAVLDPLGARVPGAAVTLLGEEALVRERTTDAEGAYEFTSLAPGRYQVVATLSGFSPVTSEPAYVSAGGRVSVDVTVQIGPLQQSVVVTTSAADLPQAQTGAPVTVVDRAAIEALNKPDLLDALRLVPGLQIEQTGARGGTTSMFIRGGASSFAKVLIDGIAANDIGGAFDFSQLQTTGVEQIEVLRQSNSVIYGSDALTGVISITTRRGRTRVPEVTYAVDGGNLGTFNSSASLGGAYKRVDYFSEYSYFTTDNDVPNNGYRNHTSATRVGLALGGSTDLSGTFRHIDGKTGSPNGFSLYGVSDDASSGSQLTYASLAARSQWTDRWQSTVRFGSTDRTSSYVNPTPTGEAFDPFGFGANYLGNQVTITGANGYSATGHAILDFGGHLPFDLRQSHDAPRAVRPDDLPGGIGHSHLWRGPIRARAGVQRPRRRAECHARQRRAVRGGTGEYRWPDVRRCRPRLRAQRRVRIGDDPPAVGGYLSAPARAWRAWRHEGDVQCRQRHQGAERVPGAKLVARARPGVRVRPHDRADRP